MLKITLLQLQEPNWGTFRNKESLFPVANNGRLSLQLTFLFLAKRLHAKARLRKIHFFLPPLFRSFVISSTDKYLLAKAAAAERAQGRLLCASLAPLPRCVSLCVCAVYWFWDRVAALHPDPSCSLSEHPTRRQDDMFRLFAIDLKKKTTQKHRNDSRAVRDNRSERPCSKTRREDCRLRRNQLVHLSLNIQEAQVLAQTLYWIALCIALLLLLFLFCSGDAIIVSTTHHPPLQPPISPSGGPPSALPQPPLTIFFFFFAALLSMLRCSDAGSLRLLGH